MTTTPTEGHTPLPWQIGSPDDTLILGPNREEIAYMHGDYDFGDAYMAMEANCAVIVTAVNERPKLLLRIKRLEGFFRDVARGCFDGGRDLDYSDFLSLGLKHGLLKVVPYDESVHGANDFGLQPGDDFYAIDRAALAE